MFRLRFRSRVRILAILALPIFALLLGLPGTRVTSAAGQQPTNAPVRITTVVTVLPRNGSAAPAIDRRDVSVYWKQQRQDVVSWSPARDAQAGLQLAILIDDADSPTAIGTHLQEIKRFILSQPSSIQIGIFYASAGAARPTADFSTDHAAVAGKLRIPLGGMAGTSPSVYLSLADLAKHWPSNGMRHEVLMIASGVDRLHPGLDSPYVEQAGRQMESSGVVVHTIYSGGSGLERHSLRMNVAWQNLTLVSGDSGGQQYFQGLETPVDFTPILRQLDTVLGNQYWLTFTTARSSEKKGELRRVQVRVEQSGVKLSYPAAVFVPGG